MDKNLQEALKWIYASLGGDITDLAAVDDITVILNAIAKLDTVQKIKSATELPAVSSTDNGDVLTVVDGEWDKAAPGGGGGSDLPDTPAQDGTYTLQNTVSSGAGTLAWVSGGGGENLVVHMDADTFTLDKTWQEIFTAVSTGISASVSSAMDAVAELCPIVKVFSGDDGYCVSAAAIDNTGYSSVVYTYIATTANDYPVMD